MTQPSNLLDNRYELLEKLGEGGMGVVYKAFDPMLNITVAIKMLHKVTPEQFLRFQQEAKTAGRLNHRNLVKILTFGMTDDKPFMVMEYIKGRDLHSAIKQDGPLPWQRAIPIFVQICEALAHAHKRGVLHRDLKTSNVILTRDPQTQNTVVKILDFGISKLTSSDSVDQRQTTPGQIIGSPLYMSPEQIAGGKIDSRSDIYSMGCLMFEVLIGRTPFVSESILGVLHQHTKDKPPTLAEFAQSGSVFPASLEEIVAKSLAKLPASRFQTMERLGNSLLAVDSELPGLPSKFWVEPPPITPRAAWTTMAIVTILLLLSGLIFAGSFHSQLTRPKVVIIPAKQKEFDQNVSKLMLSKEFPEGGVYLSVSPMHAFLSSNDLQEYKRFKFFLGFDLRGRDLDESAIKFIENMPDLKVLLLGNCEISETELRRFSKLKLLDLGITQCPNIKDFSFLKDFDKDIIILRVGLNNFTDRDLDYIKHMNLHTLGMNATLISDKGLKKVAQLPNLERLMIHSCRNVTIDGVNKLLKKRPDLVVIPYTQARAGNGKRRVRSKVLKTTAKDLERSLLELGEPANRWETKPLGDPFK